MSMYMPQTTYQKPHNRHEDLSFQLLLVREIRESPDDAGNYCCPLLRPRIG